MWLENSSMFIKEMGILGILGWNAWLDIKNSRFLLQHQGFSLLQDLSGHGMETALDFLTFWGFLQDFAWWDLAFSQKEKLGSGTAFLFWRLAWRWNGKDL